MNRRVDNRTDSLFHWSEVVGDDRSGDLPLWTKLAVKLGLSVEALWLAWSGHLPYRAETAGDDARRLGNHRAGNFPDGTQGARVADMRGWRPDWSLAEALLALAEALLARAEDGAERRGPAGVHRG